MIFVGAPGGGGTYPPPPPRSYVPGMVYNVCGRAKNLSARLRSSPPPTPRNRFTPLIIYQRNSGQHCQSNSYLKTKWE